MVAGWVLGSTWLIYNSGGKGKLSLTNGTDKGRSYSVSPSPSRRKGEFLRVTESSSPLLISPSEVVATKQQVHLAQSVVSVGGKKSMNLRFFVIPDKILHV